MDDKNKSHQESTRWSRMHPKASWIISHEFPQKKLKHKKSPASSRKHSLLFLFHVCIIPTWPFTSFTKPFFSQIWSIPIPMSRAHVRQSLLQETEYKETSADSRHPGGLSKSLIQPGMPSTWHNHQLGIAHVIGIFKTSPSLLQLAGNNPGRKVTVALPRSNTMSVSCLRC